MPTTTTDVIACVADVIEPYVTGTYKRRARAEGAANDLATAGLLARGNATTSDPEQEAANLLQARFNWPDAETIAAELSACLLLKRG